MTGKAQLDPNLAAVACQTTRATIIQAIHRLRAQGLVIHTHPTPPGPYRVQWYHLDEYSRPRAWDLLAWWAEADPQAWHTYQALVAEQPVPP